MPRRVLSLVMVGVLSIQYGVTSFAGAWLTELACTRDSVPIHLRDVSFIKLGLVIIVELILLPLLLNLPPPAP